MQVPTLTVAKHNFDIEVETEERKRAVPRAIAMKPASPSTLGLFGFAATTFILGLYSYGARLPDSHPEGTVGTTQLVFGLAFLIGGLIQIIAAVIECSCGHTFRMTTYGSYGAFWLNYAMFLIPSLGIKGAYRGDDYSFSIGIYLIIWCFVTFIFLIASLELNRSTIFLFIFLLFSLLFLSIANFIFKTSPAKIGGVFSVICAAFAFYLASSGLVSLETTYLAEMEHLQQLQVKESLPWDNAPPTSTTKALSTRFTQKEARHSSVEKMWFLLYLRADLELPWAKAIPLVTKKFPTKPSERAIQSQFYRFIQSELPSLEGTEPLPSLKQYEESTHCLVRYSWRGLSYEDLARE